MKKLSLPLFIILVLGIGWSIGFFNIPGEWYTSLTKPAFNPPGWVFAPVWSFLYVLIAIAGWRTWKKEQYGKPFLLWLLQMVLNFAWSPAFFSLHQLAVAMAILALLWLTILLFILNRWQADRPSALLFLPYAAWVSFAGVLNLSLLLLN